MGLFGPRYRDGDVIAVGGERVRLTVNPRSKTIRLRHSPRDGGWIASAPTPRHLADAVRFAESKADWILSRIAARPAPPDYSAPLDVFGEPIRLVPDGRRPRWELDRLHGVGAGTVDPQLVCRALKRRSAEVYRAMMERHCEALGVAEALVMVTDTRSRWGSCARRPGAAEIRLSWRLSLAPLAVSDYVVAHECAHILEANHGPRFWALVRELVGDPRPHRRWLVQHGSELHAFGRSA